MKVVSTAVFIIEYVSNGLLLAGAVVVERPGELVGVWNSSYLLCLQNSMHYTPMSFDCFAQLSEKYSTGIAILSHSLPSECCETAVLLK